jgi:hypothetical protein
MPTHIETLPRAQARGGVIHKAATSAKRTKCRHLFELDPLQTHIAAVVDLLVAHVAR